MNIRDLRYVVAVAEEKHFGRAAMRCNVSQPALSGQIRKLEDFLGVTLFERTNKSCQITSIGARVVLQARQLITLSDEIIDTAKAAKAPYSGHFRLGMISTIGPYLSPLILSTIRQELPELSLTLIENFTADLEKRVADGELDGAILATAPITSNLIDTALYREPFWVALCDTHPLAHQKTISVDVLPHHELLLLSDGHCLRDQILDVCHARTGAAKTNTSETSMETLLSLVAAGDGITLAPALTMSGNARTGSGRRNLVLRPEASGTAGRTVRLVSRASFPRRPLIDRLTEIIRAAVPKTMVDIFD